MRLAQLDPDDRTLGYVSRGGGAPTDFTSTVNAKFPKPVEKDVQRSQTQADSRSSDKGSSDWQTFVNGDAKGDPPADLTPPSDMTAQQVADQHPGLVQNVNDMKWTGDVVIDGKTVHVDKEGEGDIYAQQHGYANLQAMLDDKSPKAAKDTAGLAWMAQAGNNATEEDGAARPDDERTSNTLSGIRGSGEVDPDSTGAIVQDDIVHGESMDGKTTHASARTYADGESKSNATMVGEKIADFFKEVFKAIIPPLGDLIQMAEDGATKDRDEKVGDKDAEHHDSEAIKKDAKDFGKDMAEFVAQAALMVIPGVGEVAAGAMMATRVGTTVARVASRVEKVVDDAKTAIESKLDKLTGPAKEAAERGVDEAKSKVLDALETMKNKIANNDTIQSVFKAPKGATKEEKAAQIKAELDKTFKSVEDKLKPAKNEEAEQETEESKKKKEDDKKNQNNQNNALLAPMDYYFAQPADGFVKRSDIKMGSKKSTSVEPEVAGTTGTEQSTSSKGRSAA